MNQKCVAWFFGKMENETVKMNQVNRINGGRRMKSKQKKIVCGEHFFICPNKKIFCG